MINAITLTAVANTESRMMNPAKERWLLTASLRAMVNARFKLDC
jgi:hypothetical protein